MSFFCLITTQRAAIAPKVFIQLTAPAFPCELMRDQLETSTSSLLPPPPPPGKFPLPRAKMVFKCSTLSSDLFVIPYYPTKEQSSSAHVVLIKLVYKHANTSFLTLKTMILFLPDFTYYKNTTLILKLLIKVT